MDCINLRKRYGRTLRVLEEPDGRKARKVTDPWLYYVACRLGHICPWGGNMLAACSDRIGPTANRLKRLPFARVIQDGDDGVNVIFPVERFDDVAAILRPRKRRRLSEDQKAALRERLARIRPKAQAGAPQNDRESLAEA